MTKAILLSAALAFVSCTPDVRGTSPRVEEKFQRQPSSRCTTVKMHASWAEWNQSVDDLRNADLAVRVEVTDVGPGQREPLRIDGARSSDPKHYSPVYSLVTVKTKSIVWRKEARRAVPGAIELKQTGGVYDGVKYEIGDDPAFEIGQESLVFLKEVAPGMYRISGGPSGRFALKDETVNAVVPNGVHLPPGTSVSQLTGLL